MRPSYGDVLAEYRAIRQVAATVDGSHDLVWVEGPGAVGFLQGIVTQDVESMAVGDVKRSFLLGPKGKLRALLWLLRGSERVGIVTDAGMGGQVVTDLEYYRIRVKAEIRSDDRPVWSLWGPEAPRFAALTTADRWEDRAGVTIAPIPLPSLPRVLVAGELEGLALPRAGELATTAIRVEEGEPVFGRDVDESTIPQETGLVPDAVSFTKGCYLGQELVARIDSRGRVNRNLRALAITRNVLPPEGAAVRLGDKDVGRATSVAESLGSPVALALLRREVEPGDEVEVAWDGGSSPAVVRAVPVT
jgi:tRNA-modifying protein YgfZ